MQFLMVLFSIKLIGIKIGKRYRRLACLAKVN